MTATAYAPRPVVDDSDNDPFDHLYCCDPNRALCGADLAKVEEIPLDAFGLVCPMCEVLDEQECLSCAEAS